MAGTDSSFAYGATLSKPAVILDVGEAFVRCGFAGESKPRRIFRSPLRAWKTATRGGTRRGAAEWKKFAIDLITNIFMRVLRVKASERRVLLCEDYLAPSGLREGIAHALYKLFKVQGLLVVPAHTLALYPAGSGSGLVVDVGLNTTRVFPIAYSFHDEQAFKWAPLGYESVASDLAARMEKYSGFKILSGHSTNQLLEDIIAKFGQIKPSRVGDDKSGNEDEDIIFSAHGHTCKFRQNDVNLACETLLNPSDEGESLPLLILEALLRCPIDIRSLICQNIILVGGIANIHGLPENVLQRVIEDVKSNSRFKSLEGLISKMKLGKTPFGPEDTAWVGGSILAQTPVFDVAVMEPEQYAAYGAGDQSSIVYVPKKDQTLPLHEASKMLLGSGLAPADIVSRNVEPLTTSR